MPDMWMDVDTALAEVPVNIMPLLDDTDFKTIEDAVAYNAAGMALFWHFVTSAGAYTVTAVTPTTAGVYDWTDQGTAGIYTIEIPASGGASINNDTEGYGWFTGKATGVLPWRGPTIGFRAAAINDALVDGGDNLDVNTVQWLGTACATPTVAGVPEVDVTHFNGTAGTFASGRPEVNTTHAAGTAWGSGAITAASIAADAITDAKVAADVTIASVTGAVGSVTGAVGSVTAGVTVTTNNDKTGYGLSAAAVQAVWDALTTALTTVGSIGKKFADWTIGTAQTGDSFARLGAPAGASVSADIAAVKVDTAAILVDTGTDGVVVGSLGATAKSDVNAEVVDALNVDTYAEPGQEAPGATVSLVKKISYLYKAWRNRTTQTASQYTLYADNATTVDQKATFSDDATTADKGEVGTGP